MNVVTRAQWGARPPRTRTNISSNVKGLGIHWVGPKQGTWTHDKCAGKVRGIQTFHMDSRGWADIAYSHLVCPHGYIYEGRKWGTRTAANGTNEGNTYYHAICYLGGEGDPFTPEAKAALKSYVAEHRKIYGDAVRPHSWFKATGCPGNVIRQWIADGMPASGTTPAPAPSVPCEEQVLRLGSKGDCVKLAQNHLIKKGYNLGTWGADGDFGTTTENAVKQFQTDNNLTVDGIVGPRTWFELKAEAAPSPTPVNPTPIEPGGDDELAELTPEAQRFYEEMYQDLKRQDARPTSLGHVLRWMRALRQSMLS